MAYKQQTIYKKREVPTLQLFPKPQANLTNRSQDISSDATSKSYSKSTQTTPESESSKSQHRNVKYWMLRRSIKRLICESVLHNIGNDNRPYAMVLIAGTPYTGLLDSGASISVLGAGSEIYLEQAGIKFHHLPSFLNTASGQKQRIIGHIVVPVSYQGKTRRLRFHIAPGLMQPLYLGIDFWNLFGLAPAFVDSIDMDSPPEDSSKYHQLHPEQASRLGQILQTFPCSVTQGLGRTNLITHVIDVGEAKAVKQRYYQVFPVVQGEIYKELDRMLELGVIEESLSSWSSPITVVRKKGSGKVRLCLDARKVNEVTIKDAYPLPLIGDC